MLSSLGNINSINKYKSSGSGLATIIGNTTNNLNGRVKFANFSTTSTSNIYGYVPTTATVSNLSVQNSILPSISSSAQITNTIVCVSSTRGQVKTGTFTFNSANGLTICCWIYPLTPFSGSDIKVFEGDQSESMLLWQGSNSYNFNFNNATNFTLGANAWYHITCVMNRSSASQTVYVNGAFRNSSSGITGFPTSGTSISANGISIGCSLSTSHKPYNGYITDYRLYDRQLTATEIYSIYMGYT